MTRTSLRIVAIATLVGIAWMALKAQTSEPQQSALASSQATAFIGTWAFTMTEPAHFKGSEQTVRIWDHNGRVAASVQIGKFPPNNVTGIHRDGAMLVLTLSHDAQPAMMENGVPLWAAIVLTLNGGEMSMAQMLERSQTIKRGAGHKQSQ
jgi:hypothetical protein